MRGDGAHERGSYRGESEIPTCSALTTDLIRGMPAQSTTEHFATNVRHASGCPGARRETGAGWCGKQYATYAAYLGRTWSTAIKR